MMRPKLLPRHVLLAVHHNVELGSRDASPIHTGKLQGRSDVQVGDGLLEQLERNSGVEQRAQEHVAADAGETIEIGNTHRSCQELREIFIIGNAETSVKPAFVPAFAILFFTTDTE